MSHLQTYQVFPSIPKPLAFLETLARNLWWCWHIDAIELFRRIDPRLWEQSGRNPILFLSLIKQGQLEALAEDDSFLAHQDRLQKAFESQLAPEAVSPDAEYDAASDLIAYFSMEFGIHESLPLFAGGLGILSGDHLKAASDMALPLIGVGLLYRKGYFHQYLDHSGWQQEAYPETDLYHLPVERAKNADGNEIQITVEGPEGDIQATVWKLMVGRIPLYLLDTNIPENPADIRHITSRLYAGEDKIRLAQEVLLGIGGMRALKALGIHPTVCHMNEGHCAFAPLERLVQTMQTMNIDLKAALEIVPRTTVFTTHTPVAAGHDEFDAESVKPYLKSIAKQIGLTADQLIGWGRPPGAEPNGPLSMFVLAMRLAEHCNGVSRLHGSVARRMWAHVWPDRPEDEVPITHITNGVHIPSFISIDNALLFERYLGPEWYLHAWNSDISTRIDQIYDEELWRAHEMSRSRLIRACRTMLVKQYKRRNAPNSIIEAVESVLDQETLTIAFARRFATYKRAYLLLNDPERLERLITDSNRPVQLVFAGKAHPKDNEGKELIKRVFEFAHRSSVRHRVVFLEDYDINIARYLVQGADIWLNTPRRPFEACGTSGMKAAANGVLNTSILDGWWCEGYDELLGWRIGNGEEYEDYAYQDAVESQALYNILENDVIPCFYDRKNGDAPERWIRMMKASMKKAMNEFCAHRMLQKYEQIFYLPAARQFHQLVDQNAAMAHRLKTLRERLEKSWKEVRIGQPERNSDGPFRVGDRFHLTCEVYLGELLPEEVDVELYHGGLKSIDLLTASHSTAMAVEEDRGDGHYRYGCDILCEASGRFGFTARILPRGDNWIKYTPGFLSWA